MMGYRDMVCAGLCLSVVLLLVHFPDTESALASTWGYCECYWGAWAAWSDCDSDCFGRRSRSRSVWFKEHPGCSEFNDCATNDEGWDYQDCNNVCHNGGSDSGYYWSPCTCVAGYKGSCCTESVTCGDPGSIEDGSVSVTSTYYSGTATYTCNTHYNMTGGDSVRTCQDNSAWSGSQPACVFVNHCGSSPCQNGATCVDLLGDFRCDCTQGWSGKLCENDIQPPFMSGCSGDVYVNATDHTVYLNWTEPTFTDDRGSDLDIVSNYPSPEFIFPWGDFTVQYSATKLSNGLVTECTFQVKVRPTPCEELNIPVNGARLCNGWKTDYGQFCMITCEQNSTLPPSYSYHTWYVCGASGTWIAAGPVPDCEIIVDSTVDAEFYQPEYADYAYTSSCTDDVTVSTLQNLYIDNLQQKEGFSSFCSNNPTECQSDNVDVQCSTGI